MEPLEWGLAAIAALMAKQLSGAENSKMELRR